MKWIYSILTSFANDIKLPSAHITNPCLKLAPTKLGMTTLKKPRTTGSAPKGKLRLVMVEDW